MDYYFEDFTETNYVKILQLAKSKCRFCDYEELLDESQQNIIVWRHDIDMSVHRALKLANLERENNVSAVYFVHLNSAFYNVFEKVIREMLKKIGSMHEIGIHFDCGMYEGTPTKSKLEEDLGYYKTILEKFLEVRIKSFSFHNPTREILELFSEEKYAGLYNAYAERIMTNASYCSDSNGYWRYQRLQEFLSDENHSRMCVLTHPVWWVPKVLPPRERIQRAIDGRSNAVARAYDEEMRALNRKNII